HEAREYRRAVVRLHQGEQAQDQTVRPCRPFSHSQETPVACQTASSPCTTDLPCLMTPSFLGGVPLVPKLCLGTFFWQLRFGFMLKDCSGNRVSDKSSQTEFGNQEKRVWEPGKKKLSQRHEAPIDHFLPLSNPFTRWTSVRGSPCRSGRCGPACRFRRGG